MNNFQKQLKEKLERLRRIEMAVAHKDYVPDPSLSYDTRLLGVVELLVIHVGVLEENHNALVHSVRMSKQAPSTSPIIEPS